MTAFFVILRLRTRLVGWRSVQGRACRERRRKHHPNVDDLRWSEAMGVVPSVPARVKFPHVRIC
jgi:hypothetical protein